MAFGRVEGLTRRAGVIVSSTSKRQMVFLMGRSARGGTEVIVDWAMIAVVR